MANRRYIDFPIASTSGDTDIILIWQGGANKQTTKATFLSGLPENLDELNDVAISGLTNGQILRYDSVTGKWENTDQGNLDLNDLNDVSIVSPSNGQVLVYNSSTSRWENSSGGYVPYTGAVTTVNLGAQTIQAGSFVKAGGTAAQFLKANGSVDSTAYGTGTVTSVALTMPTAFTVGGSPITTAGTLAVTGAGTVGQYIRGDGSLADFPESSGGGSSVSYYLNGSVNQGTIGGVAYKELNKVPILGAGTDFTINADGYIASFITDAGDPNLLEIPGGNWTFETYFSASSGGGSPTFYVELYKVNSGGTATLIASNSTFPELIAFGTNIISYFSTLAVPTTALALTDRLAIRYYVTHSGRTITLHTEDNHLCQIITTFTTGLTALNGLTAQIQNFAVGTSGTDFAISSATATHTFNLPTANATNRGALSSADWTTFNGKQNALTNPVTGTGASGQVAYFTGTSAISSESNLFWDATNDRLGIGTASPSTILQANFSNSNAYSSGVTSNALMLYNTSTTNNQYVGLYFLGEPAAGNAGQATIYGITTGSGAMDLAFSTRGSSVLSERMRITSGGNLGIGTETPNDLMEIKSSLANQANYRLYNTFNSGANNFGVKWFRNYDSATNSLACSINYVRAGGTAGYMDFHTGNVGAVAERMRISQDGNVIIQSGGTPSDNGARLQVSGTATFSSSVAAQGFQMNGTGGYGVLAKADGINSAANGAYIGFVNNINSRYFISQLDTNNDINYYYFNGASWSSSLIKLTNTGAGLFSTNLFAGGSVLSSPSGADTIIGAYGGQDCSLILQDAVQLWELYVNDDFYINRGSTNVLTALRSNGNVGIGTDSPAGKLEINGLTFVNNTGDSTARLLLRNSTTGANAGGLDIRQIGVDASINNASNGYLSISTNNTERLRIDSVGTVDIKGNNNNVSGMAALIARLGSNADNTSSYGYVLESGGANRCFIYGNGNIVNSNNSYGALSDIKLKENITDASYKLDDLMKVKVRNFNYIGDDKKQIGVIAQELEQIFPGMIDESEDYEELQVPQLDKEGNAILNEEGKEVFTKERVKKGTTTKSVKYSVFVPMLIKAIQEQQEIINDLKQKLQ